MQNTAEAEQNSYKLIIVLAVTLVFSGMNATLFHIVLPVISNQLSLSTSKVSWIATSYVIVYAFGSLTYGKLADKFRLKDLMTVGLSIFALGSIIGMSSNSYWMIILGRVVQASGASVIPAAAMIIPARYFPLEKRGRALGTVAVGIAIADAFGPIFSGLITEFSSWRFLFSLSLVPLLTLPFYRKYLKDEPGNGGKMDVIGGILTAGAVILLMMSISRGQWGLVVAAVLFIMGLLWRLRSVPEPYIPPQLFKNRRYVAALTLAAMNAFLNVSISFIPPQFLTDLNKLSPLAIGLVLFPGAIAAAIAGRIGGKIADVKGNLVLVFLAASLTFMSFALLSSFVGAHVYVVAAMILLGYVGQTFMQIVVMKTISQSLEKNQIGIGMGVFTLMNFISGALAIQSYGKLLDTETGTIPFHRLPLSPSAVIYSNLYFLLALFVLAVLAVYVLSLRKSSS